MTHKPAKPGVRITALTAADAAKILSTAGSRRITADQVRQVAEAGDLLRADGTFSMIEYVAYLAREVAGGLAD